MSYLGDYATSTVIYGKFTTFQPSTGAAFALAGTPALSVYKDNSTTQSTSGVTLTASFDSVTGLNHFAIDTSSDGTFYSAGSNFDVVITTGTVDSVSVVGAVVASFSIAKTAALRPTTAGRTLDVSSGGEAGLDWANIGSPSTAQNLSGTNIDADQVVASVTGAVGSVTGNVGGNVTGSVGSVSGAVGSVTGNVGGTVNGLTATAQGNVRTAVGLASANMDTQLGPLAKLDDTLEDDGGTYRFTENALEQAPSGGGGSAPTAEENADALLDRNIAGGGNGTRTVGEALKALRNKTAIAGGTLTVYEADDSTPAWTATVTTAAGDPLSSIDPA